eukprot:scaffold10284_cov118-Isochrysis_galbana.AAC.9
MQPTFTSRMDAAVAVLHTLIYRTGFKDHLGPLYATWLQEIKDLQKCDSISTVFVQAGHALETKT